MGRNGTTSRRRFGSISRATKRKLAETWLKRQADRTSVIKHEPDSIEQKPDFEVLELENLPIEFSDLVANQGL